jgi:hypothetical protein
VRSENPEGDRGLEGQVGAAVSLVAFALVMVPLALSAFAATFGLVIVFFVVFPVLVQGLIAFALAQVMGERAENQEYLARRRVQRR